MMGPGACGEDEPAGTEDIAADFDRVRGPKAGLTETDIHAECAVAGGIVVGGDGTDGAARRIETTGRSGVSGPQRSRFFAFCGMQKGLAGNATGMQALAAECLVLDEDDAGSEASCGLGGDEPRRPAADDEEITDGAGAGQRAGWGRNFHDPTITALLSCRHRVRNVPKIP
jgi:hypothetical protein